MMTKALRTIRLLSLLALVVWISGITGTASDLNRLPVPLDTRSPHPVWDEFINYPLDEVVHIEEYAMPQFQAAGLIGSDGSVQYCDVLCHGYAWGVACGFNDPDYNWILSEHVPANFAQCDPADATHLVWYKTGEHPILDAQHSAIISQFEYFPYAEGWVQALNGPCWDLVLFKIEVYNRIHPDFKVAYYDLRNIHGLLPWKVLPLTPSPNLVAHWSFDRVNSSGRYPDHAGLHHGKLVNFPYTLPAWAGDGCFDNGSAPLGDAACFVGNNFVEVEDNPDCDLGEGDFSMAFWLNAKTTSDVVLFDKRDPTSLVGYHGYIYHNRMLFQMHGSNGWSNYYSSTGHIINDGSCHLVVITVDRDDPQGGRIYVDSTLELIFNPRVYYGSLDNNVPLYFGRHTNPTKPGFVGMLDNFRIWKRALSADEVNAIHTAELP